MSTTDAVSMFRQLRTPLRSLLVAATGLSFGAGFALTILTKDTERFFSWTIASPLTAAFLGAGYWFGTVFVLLAARERAWANARIAVPGVLLFTIGVLAATLIHLDRFHTDSITGWLWIATYVIVPPAMLLFLIMQIRAPGVDPPKSRPLPHWLKLLLVSEAAVLLALGLGLFIAPATVDGLWPWELTPLTARVGASGLAALGVILGKMAWENDMDRVQIGFISLIVLGVLELIATLRYPDEFSWSSPQGWIYLLGVCSVVAIGVYGWWATRLQAARLAVP